MMSINRNITREHCGKCTKQIYIGQSAIVCNKCDLIFHSTCLSDYVIFREKLYCPMCISTHDIIRYNPFYSVDRSDGQHDRVYNNDVLDFTDTFDNVYQVLEQCQQYSPIDVGKILTTKSASIIDNNNFTNTDDSETRQPFSHLFYNLDGNATNFDLFLCDLKGINYDFSIIGLAETNTEQVNKDLYKIDGYTSCYQSTKEGKHKGTGVCLYIHDKYNFTELTDISITTVNAETLFVKLTNVNEPTIVGVVYNPPAGDNNLFRSEFGDILSNLPADHTVYILGDYNVDLLNERHSDTVEFENIIFPAGFIPLISTHTHHRDNCRKTCIDNILTNNPEQVVVSGTLLNDRHHKPVFQLSYIKSTITPNTKQKVKIFYDYSNQNIEKLCDYLVEQADNMNTIENFENFNEFFTYAIDKTCKLDIPKITKRNSVTNPWITTGIITSVLEKIRLYEDWTKSKSNFLPDGEPVKYNAYKEHRKILCWTIKLAKKSYYGRKFEKFKTDPKKTWGLINDLRGKCKVPPKSSFVIGGERIECRRVIANKFNEYFVSLASNLNATIQPVEGIPISNIPSFCQYLARKVESSIYLHNTYDLEIMEIIKEFENGKASDIPTILIKKSAKIISPILARLYNNCMDNGTFPEIFKTGKITPIFKKGNKEKLENYRPVSILPIFGKIFEKIIYKRISGFLSKENVLNDNQFGFRKGHSTVHALHSSVRKIEVAMDSRMHTVGIFIDLSKAFDTLDHNIMLEKLDHYGIRGIAKNLLESYLKGRFQYTNFDGESSEKLIVRYGVPQGSILGPLLFLLYINDLMNCYNGEHTDFILYADDTNIFVVGNTKEEAFEKANRVLENVHVYMKCNLLHINMEKCCYMHFQPRKLTESHNCSRTIPFVGNKHMTRAIYINGQQLKEVSETKFLGVILDNKLDWTSHIHHLNKKLRSAAALLSRIRHWIPEEQYLKIYHALFESHLTYGISVWGGVSDSKLNKIFTVQKHSIRILFGDRKSYLEKFQTCARVRPKGEEKLGSEFYSREHTKPLLTEHKLLAVRNLYHYFCTVDVFKILKFRTPISLYDKYKVSNRETSLALITPKRSNQFFYKSSVAWNSVYKKCLENPHCDLTTKISYFKDAMKKLLLSKQNEGEKIEWQKSNFKLY